MIQEQMAQIPMTLEEKINYEFQCFYLDQMRTSKENIFSHSEEIELKKKLKEELLFWADGIDETTQNILLMQSNLLESTYCFRKELRAKSSGDDVRETVRSWLTFVKQRRKNGHG